LEEQAKAKADPSASLRMTFFVWVERTGNGNRRSLRDDKQEDKRTAEPATAKFMVGLAVPWINSGTE
jgi:hypothetical protein